MRQTSLSAYRQMQDSGRIIETTEQILFALMANPEGLTRRELEDKTGLRINQISGRVKELINSKRVVEDGKRACRITGNTVFVVKIIEQCLAMQQLG